MQEIWNGLGLGFSLTGLLLTAACGEVRTDSDAGNSGQIDAANEATCSDGEQNQDEVEVDCGGVCPPCETLPFLTVGRAHSCVVVNGSAKCWGSNEQGELGLGDLENRGDANGEMAENLPIIALGSNRSAKSIVAGEAHTCAILDNGSVKCWGANQSGQLGIGSTEGRGGNPNDMGDNLPAVDLGTGRTATALALGSFHTCALLDNSSVKCWGENAEGQLGQGDTRPRGTTNNNMGDQLLPIDLGDSKATAIAAGYSHSCALLEDGSVKCWGSNLDGQLGQGDDQSRGAQAGELGSALLPIPLGEGKVATAIATGDSHSCALLSDGALKCWGANFSGALGQGNKQSYGGSPSHLGDNLMPIPLGSQPARSVSAGMSHTCALLEDSSLKCWGANFAGALGQGDTENRGDTPNEMGKALATIDLGSDRGARQVAAAQSHTCAVLDDNSVKCWGNNDAGQLGQEDTERRGNAPDQMGDNLPPIELGF